MEGFDYSTFLSVFTWRYGSKEMRKIFSELEYRRIWRQIWLYLAEAQSQFGLVSEEELADIKKHSSEVDIAKAHEIEKRIRHDLMAELNVFAEQAKVGGGKLHLGATSMDIEDNADILRIKMALDLILTRTVNVLSSISKKIEEYKNLTCMGWTHLQPAEPTTVGYRLSMYAQDLVMDIRLIEFILGNFVKGKGLKGAVGTSASFANLLRDKEGVKELEHYVMNRLGINSFRITSQTYPRKVDLIVLSGLSSIAQTCSKFALDVRILQSPVFGEWSEPTREEQVGSSTMAFKRNPVTCERICSLARYIESLHNIAFQNASLTILERTLDDSASRRIIIPEAFLACEECLILFNKVIRGLRIYPEMVKKNLEKFGPFASTEAIMMRLVKLGEDRQKIHERIRRISMKAWEEVLKGKENPIVRLLSEDDVIGKRLNKDEIERLVNPYSYIGDAKERVEEFLDKDVRPILEMYKDRIRGEVEQVF
jgi:adenylosuccinate lyase